MSRGDEESIEESKLPESTAVGAGDSGGNDPHGDVSRADVTQDVSDIQRGDDDDVHDWDFEILNHVLVEILNKERVDARASDDFTVFMITNGFGDVSFLMMMTEGDFHAMGHLIDFKTLSLLQALNKMYNEFITDGTDETTESTWFLSLKSATSCATCYVTRKSRRSLRIQVLLRLVSPWDDRILTRRSWKQLGD